MTRPARPGDVRISLPPGPGPAAPTPRLTPHARDRCAEMGIPTKRAKRVVQQRTIQYPGHPGHGNNGVTVMSDDPDIAVVWDPTTNQIMTVIWRTQDVYIR